MRKSLVIFAALVVMSSAVAVANNEGPSNHGFAIVPVKGSEVFKVVYKAEVSSRVKLTIYNSNDVVVFRENFHGTDGFIRPLNFNGLPAGEYTIEVADAKGKRIEKVFYQPHSSIKQVHVRRIPNESGKFLVAIANSGTESVLINILDSQNNIVYSDYKTINGDFATVYNVKNGAASFTFQITDKAGNVKSIKL